MAPSETSTLRVPTVLRDEIARIAAERGTSMLDVVTDAIHRLDRDEWWATVHGALDATTGDEAAVHASEVELLDTTTTDGLRGA